MNKTRLILCAFFLKYYFELKRELNEKPHIKHNKIGGDFRCIWRVSSSCSTCSSQAWVYSQSSLKILHFHFHKWWIFIIRFGVKQPCRFSFLLVQDGEDCWPLAVSINSTITCLGMFNTVQRVLNYLFCVSNIRCTMQNRC